MAVAVQLSEAWIRRQPALRGLPTEQVESISLQGTHAAKIVSLGDGLKAFKNLQSLDLSKNLLACLEMKELLGSVREKLPTCILTSGAKRIHWKKTSQGTKYSSPRHMPCHDERDSYLKTSPASVLTTSKLTKGNKDQILLDNANARQFLSHNSLDREQKLRSPTALQAQTSLPSQMKSRAVSGKGKFHVSFSEGSSLDFLCPGKRETGNRKVDFLDLGRAASPPRRLSLSDDAGKTNLRPESYEHLYSPSSANRRELVKRLHDERNEKTAADDVCNYTSQFANEVLGPARSSCGDFLGQHSEADADHSSSLKLSSASTSFGDFLSKHRSLLSEVSLGNSQSATALTSTSRKGRDPPACRSLSPSRMEFKHTSSQHTPVNPKHCFKEPVMELHSREHSDSPLQTASIVSSTEKQCLLVTVLQQLLDLVDRYWNGSGSLFINKDFLAPARDLLAYLMTAARSQQDVCSTRKAILGPSSSGFSCQLPREHPKYSQQHISSVIEKAMRKVEERQSPTFKERGVEGGAAAAATSSSSSHGIYSLSYDELLSRNEQLNAQVDILTFELKQLKKQQDTISLLKESQRSLVSTNNFLLQQLNKEQDPSVGKTRRLSEKIPDAPCHASCPARTSHRASLTSPIAWNPEMLSSCPL
ncbi:leucine-rich repeat-containing protein 36 isoform X2 [Zootoca vivipara]|uniref:leucine-rich repeat-containing protein 36 isoform X2 n=1 Tax=Zootoca vivipara TaxID=8524 RepID=UPI00293BD1DA|nr:leucine-rich repeat-containing protein 36 isoform X2 [Zootoca vivipara]